MKPRIAITGIIVIFICWILAPVAASAGQWYRGDLHSHSLYSDGDSPVADVVASVEAKGLDFFALTDHDTDMDGDPVHWFDPAYTSNNTVLLFGVEWTTGDGHANVWAADPFDYGALWEANRAGDPLAAVQAARDQSALFSINHPARNAWDYPVVEGVNCVEIWNGPMLVNQNYKATHEHWDRILLERRRVTGVGGSDTHELKGFIAPFTGHGNPTTWVYADSKDAERILEGIARGRVSVSYTYDAPRLEFTADGDGDGIYETMMGDSLVTTGVPAAFKISLVDGLAGPGDRVPVPDSIVRHLNQERVTFWDILWFVLIMNKIDTENLQFVTAIKDGELFKAWLISGGVDTLEFADSLPSEAPAYYRVELYGEPDVEGLSRLVYGLRTAVTNPIYANY